MDINKQLIDISQVMGEQVGEEQLREHQQFCDELEENIVLGEGGEIVKKVVTSVLLLMVRGEYALEVKRACSTLIQLVLHRCETENPSVAKEVRNGLIEIAATIAWDLVPTSVPGNTLKH